MDISIDILYSDMMIKRIACLIFCVFANSLQELVEQIFTTKSRPLHAVQINARISINMT
jgi:hypothetical protein